MDEASRAFVLCDSKWERSIGSGNELGSELYGAMVVQPKKRRDVLVIDNGSQADDKRAERMEARRR